MKKAMKGVVILTGALAGAALVTAAGPILVVSSPLWGIFGTTYSISAIGAAGVSCGIAGGYALGKITGQAGITLVIEGLDEVAERLVNNLAG